MGRLILDTGLLIANLRGELTLDDWIAVDDVALPAVVLAEFLEGVHRTTDEDRSGRLRGYLDEVTARVPTVDYTAEVAEHHGELLAYARRAGKPRGVHDLIIAATARATDRTILTRDARARFDELPGVSARVVGDG